MKKILFPVDFSDASLNAFQFALRLAKKIHAEIITLHVYDAVLMPYLDYHDYIMEHYEINEWDQFENFKDEVPKLRAIAEKQQLERVVVQHVLKQGDTEATILNVAAEENVDFIVMGTKGASGLQEVFLGSITQKIMLGSQIPVLAIPKQCSYTSIKKILFLTEYKIADMSILNKVYQLAQVFQAHISVVQVSVEDQHQDQVFSKEWEKRHPKSDVNFYLLTSNDIEGTINDFVHLQKISMVTISIHHYGFFEKLFKFSLSKKLIFHSEIPVLSIPADKK